MKADDLRELATDALRFWEPMRLFYNLLLTAVVLVHFALGGTGSWRAVNFNAVLGLFVLTVLANVAYCAAYPVDLFLQISHFREQRRVWRSFIVGVGFTFAAVLTHLFASGFFVNAAD